MLPHGLQEQVRLNRRRFPEDFMFQLTVREAGLLRSQMDDVVLDLDGLRRERRRIGFQEE